MLCLVSSPRITSQVLTKTEAKKYVSELLKWANYFLVEHPENYSILTEQINQARKQSSDNVPPALREAERVKELLEPLKKAIHFEQLWDDKKTI